MRRDLARVAALLEVAMTAGSVAFGGDPPPAGEPPPAAADLILTGGVFYPVEPPDPVRGALATAGGRIVYLGPAAGAAGVTGPATRIIDLAGRAVTPGLIDAHGHLLGLGAALEQVDLAGTASYEEVVERVRRTARERPAGEWIVGRGWDQNDWPAGAFPSHDALSLAVPDHAVWLVRVDGHAALLNARALDRLAIDPAAPDPPGGRRLRDSRGRLTGVLVDRAMTQAASRLPAPSPADLARRLRLAAARCAAFGLTAVADMGVGEAQIAAYEAAATAGELPLRAALFLDDEPELLEDWFARGPRLDPRASRLLIRGVKLYADGALGSRGAALLEPYADDPGNHGLLTATREHLGDIARRALDAGFQVAVHAIGDRGAQVALDALEEALGGPRPDARFRLEHLQVVAGEDVRRLGRLGIVASMQPTHATSDMAWAEARLGPARLGRAYAWRRMLAGGARLALGSDFPVESPDPRLGLYAAVSRQDLAGHPPGGWLAAERLTREEALRGFTLDAAYALFLDAEVGSLAVGKRADLVVFGRDPLAVPAGELPRVEVDLVLRDGEIIHRREGI